MEHVSNVPGTMESCPSCSPISLRNLNDERDPPDNLPLRCSAAILLACLLPGLDAAANAANAANQETVWQGKTLPQWVEQLSGETDRVRWYAAYALGQIGPDAAVAVDPLCKLLADRAQYEYVRGAAAWALGRIGDGSPQVVDLLIATLGSDHDSVRRNSARALGNLGPAARSRRRSPGRHVQRQGRYGASRCRLGLLEARPAARRAPCADRRGVAPRRRRRGIPGGRRPAIRRSRRSGGRRGPGRDPGTPRPRRAASGGSVPGPHRPGRHPGAERSLAGHGSRGAICRGRGPRLGRSQGSAGTGRSAQDDDPAVRRAAARRSGDLAPTPKRPKRRWSRPWAIPTARCRRPRPGPCGRSAPPPTIRADGRPQRDSMFNVQ